MALSIKHCYYTECHSYGCYILIVRLSVAFFYCNADGPYADCQNAEYPGIANLAEISGLRGTDLYSVMKYLNRRAMPAINVKKCHFEPVL